MFCEVRYSSLRSLFGVLKTNLLRSASLDCCYVECQESTHVAARGAGTNPILREGVITDNPSLQITTVKLDGNNFLTWSRSAILSIQSRGLYLYLIGISNKPEKLILRKMDSRRFIGYVLLASFSAAKYYKIGNDAQVYELVKKAHETKQAERSLPEYYADLRAMARNRLLRGLSRQLCTGVKKYK